MAQASRTFRIFVSSTFSDLKEERNALQQEVFPRLRELCMQHGTRFQAIDLRWGVSDEPDATLRGSPCPEAKTLIQVPPMSIARTFMMQPWCGASVHRAN